MLAARRAALLKEYEHVTQQFRALTQIRFKLLAFLPLGTIGTLAVLKYGEKTEYGEKTATPAPVALFDFLVPFALFGFFVTLAIFVYNLRNDQFYDELVGRAAQIERDLKLFDGSFAQRPDKWHRLLPGVYVEHRWPIHLVYVASAALWLWMILFLLGQSWMPCRGIVSVTIAVVFAVWLMWHLKHSREASKKLYREAVRAAMKELLNASPDEEARQRAVKLSYVLAKHFGKKKAQRFETRIFFYLRSLDDREFLPRRRGRRLDVRTASYILGYTIDMPARWIRDVHSGRRES